MSSTLPTNARKNPRTLLILGGLVLLAGLIFPKLINTTSASSPSPPPAATPAPQPVAETSQSSPSVLLVKMVVGIGLVGGIAVALARTLRPKPLKPPKNMEVIASIALDSRCLLQLVRAGDRRILVGIDHTGVKTLTELPATWPEAK